MMQHRFIEMHEKNIVLYLYTIIWMQQYEQASVRSADQLQLSAQMCILDDLVHNVIKRGKNPIHCALQFTDRILAVTL